MNTATIPALAGPRTSFDRISLRRLVLIRSVAVTGQAITILTVHFLLGFKLPLLPALPDGGHLVYSPDEELHMWPLQMAATPAGPLAR